MPKCGFRKCRRNAPGTTRLQLHGTMTLPTCGQHRLFDHLYHNLQGRLQVLKIDAADPFKIWDKNSIPSFKGCAKIGLENFELGILELRHMLNDDFKSKFDKKFKRESEALAENVKLWKLDSLERDEF